MTDGFLGIDISKKTFDVSLIINDKHKTKKFSNTKGGYTSLMSWLDAKCVVVIQACMEATGTYGTNLAEYLYHHNIPVSVVNPSRIKGFSQSELARSKNDVLDAKLIARFCKLIRPKLWSPTPEHIKKLQQLVRRLDDLTAMLRQDENRLDSADKTVEVLIEQHILFIKEQIKATKLMIKKHIQEHKDLDEKSKLLHSIPGIADSTTAQVLAFLHQIDGFKSAKEVAAFVGLNPKQRQSGSSVNGRTHLSKTGDSALRKAFYMPAVVSMRFNPIIREFSARLEEAGKHKMLIVGAAMRKLIHIIFGVLKSGKPFDENIMHCS